MIKKCYSYDKDSKFLHPDVKVIANLFNVLYALGVGKRSYYPDVVMPLKWSSKRHG